MEKGESAIEKFNTGIEALKVIELHEGIQNKDQNMKFLSDIYYDISGMHRWKRKCLSDQASIKQKREQVLDRMRKVKDQIRFIKNDKIIPNKRKFIEENENIEKKDN